MPMPNIVQVQVEKMATVKKTSNKIVISVLMFSAFEVYAVTELIITVTPLGLIN